MSENPFNPNNKADDAASGSSTTNSGFPPAAEPAFPPAPGYEQPAKGFAQQG